MLIGPSGWVGKPVKDIYGRTLGRSVGVRFKLDGEVQSIGAEIGGEFVELPLERVSSDEVDLVIIPGWLLEARKAGIERDSFGKRIAAIEKMIRRKEISSEQSDAIYKSLMAVQKTHEAVLEAIRERLDSLEKNAKSIDEFGVALRVQFLAEEMDGTVYKLSAAACEAMKSANSKETADLLRSLGGATGGDETVQAASPEELRADVLSTNEESVQGALREVGLQGDVPTKGDELVRAAQPKMELQADALGPSFSPRPIVENPPAEQLVGSWPRMEAQAVAPVVPAPPPSSVEKPSGGRLTEAQSWLTPLQDIEALDEIPPPRRPRPAEQDLPRPAAGTFRSLWSRNALPE